jgi:hypothetical protein
MSDEVKTDHKITQFKSKENKIFLSEKKEYEVIKKIKNFDHNRRSATHTKDHLRADGY